MSTGHFVVAVDLSEIEVGHKLHLRACFQGFLQDTNCKCQIIFEITICFH